MQIVDQIRAQLSDEHADDSRRRSPILSISAAHTYIRISYLYTRRIGPIDIGVNSRYTI